jgi:hypothetical protein
LRWYVGNYGTSDRFYVYDEEIDSGVYLAQDATSWTASSDARLKENVQTLSVLDRLDGYRAVSFDWKANGNHDLGVIAQELYPLFPELVERGDEAVQLSSATSSNAWGVHYDRLGALALQGVKELNLKLEDLATTSATTTDQTSLTSRFFTSLFARLTHWFADTTNGIAKFFAGEIHTEKLCTTRSDGTEVCANGDQLAAILAGTSADVPTWSGGGAGAPASTPAPDLGNDADTATTTTPSDIEPAAGSVDGESAEPAAVSDVENEADDAEVSTLPEDSADPATSENADDKPPAEEPAADPPPELAPANDNGISEPLPATGTE